MSLAQVAKHLEHHGRGNDTHLVHMTTGELQALQALAQRRGGSLTINPHTGLPEAGFLSSILPMVAGVALDAMSGGTLTPLMTAGIVGAGDAAVTGSLSKGLMAGLGAWGGANLGESLTNLGTTNLATQGASDANTAFQQAAGQANQVGVASPSVGAFDASGGYQLNPSASGMVPATPAVSPTVTAAQSTISSMPNLTPTQVANMTGNLTEQNAADVVKGAGAANAAMGATGNTMTNLSTMGQGLYNSAGTGAFNSLSNLGAYAKANPVTALMAGTTALSALNSATQASIPASTGSSNPMGMKMIPRDANGNPIFSASIPTPPAPAYQAQYPNYQVNPYHAKAGGLMDVKHYDGSDDSLVDFDKMLRGSQEVASGIQTATKRPTVSMGQTPDGGIYVETEQKYQNMDPYQRTMAKLKDLHTSTFMPGSVSIPSVGGLGAIPTNPALVQAQQQANPQAMAHGGLMHYAAGDVVKQLANMQGAYQAGTSGSMPEAAYNLAQNLASLRATPAVMAATYTQDLNPNESADLAHANRERAPAAGDMGHRGYQRPEPYMFAQGGLPFRHHYATGGSPMSDLGGYSDGGHLLKGPGDGVSDSIPASISGKQPARLADGEFVIPARIVSELGNGSTDAGAKRLYEMMDRIKAKRLGTKNIAADTKAYKYLPA